MAQKNIVIALLVLVLLFLAVGYAGRYYSDLKMAGEEMEEPTELDEGADIPTSADNAPPGSIHNLPVPEAVAAVRAQVATELGISEGKVIVMSAYEREWSDGCLGLGGPAESCIAMITSGYEVTVLAEGKERVFRTNADGSVIREEVN